MTSTQPIPGGRGAGAPAIRPAQSLAPTETSMLARFLAPISAFAYTCLRIAAGLMFTFHGLQTLFGFLAEAPTPVGSQVWIGGILELVAGVAIATGVFTTWPAFLASGMMAVAYVQFHWKLRFDANFFPAKNGGELALLYSFLFLYIACRSASAQARKSRAA